MFGLKKHIDKAVQEGRRAALQEFSAIIDAERMKREEFRDDYGESGNDYPSYEQATKELSKKYDGDGEWGCQFASIVVDARAATILGGGLTYRLPKGREKEKDWIREFLEYNGLDEEGMVNVGRDGEIEGKVLCLLVEEKDDEGNPKVGVRFLSWVEHQYKIHTSLEDYTKIEKVTYRPHKDSEEKELRNIDRIVFIKLAGRTHNVNETRSKSAKVIMQMENADRALQDLRRIDKLFATPTPFLSAETRQEAQSNINLVESSKWKIGKFLSGSGKLEFVSAGMQGGEILLKEVTMCVQIISAGTGIPPHWLGFPELMSNRSTAENLLELITVATAGERKVYTGGWKEIITKAMVMNNQMNGTSLNPEGLEVDLPFVTSSRLTELVDVWATLQEKDVISMATLRSKVPGLDVDEEEDRLREESEAEAGDMMDPRERARREIADQLEAARDQRLEDDDEY